MFSTPRFLLSIFSISFGLMLIQKVNIEKYISTKKNFPETVLGAQTKWKPECINWKKPEIPKVGLQAGHWKIEELPQELAKLRTNTGAHAGKKVEWKVNYEIAQKTTKLLKESCIETEILPATVSPGYKSSAFISIHADYNPDPKRVGFKVASPQTDQAGQSAKLAKSIKNEYQKSTNMTQDPEITIAMLRYYAFSHDRFEHAISPDIPAVIIETGFMSNKENLQILTENPQLPAEGIAKGIIEYLKENY